MFLALMSLPGISASAQNLSENEYYLPKTAVRMVVLMERDSDCYRIVNMDLKTVGVPDKAKKYQAVMHDEHNVNSLVKDKDGVLLAVNTKANAVEQPEHFTPAPKPAQVPKGTFLKDTTEHVFMFVPEKEEQKHPMFRFSYEKGLVDLTDTVGVVYSVSVEDKHYVPNIQTNIERGKKVKSDAGIYVNRPGKIKISIYRDKDMRAALEFYAAQFGVTEPMDNGMFCDGMKTLLTLNPVTGNVDSIQMQEVKKKKKK